MEILIKGGRVIDPANNLDEISDVLVEKGKIKEIGKNLKCNPDKIIDAEGNWVCPGFIDLHVHLRTPGFEYKEDIETGTKSAALGGFTTICAMPNTKPVTDNAEVVTGICREASEKGIVHVLPIGSVTKGQKGQALSDIEDMVKAGACGLSEDGYTATNAQLLKEALKKCKELDIPMFSHCEDIDLVNGGVINEGVKSAEYGLKGISNSSEEVIVARDIIVANEVGTRIHLCHMSTEGCANIIEDAKRRGVQVTAEVTPHHFSLCDEDITENDGKYKMNPPLRSRRDMEAIIKALKDNVIEVIGTDHAPHHADEKTGGFEKAANGIVGLETALSLGIMNLVDKGILTPSQLIEKMTINPAKVINSNKGKLSIGMDADISIVDYKKEYIIDISEFASKSKNSPFDGMKAKGKVKHVLVSGKIVVENYELL